MFILRVYINCNYIQFERKSQRKARDTIFDKNCNYIQFERKSQRKCEYNDIVDNCNYIQFERKSQQSRHKNTVRNNCNYIQFERKSQLCDSEKAQRQIVIIFNLKGNHNPTQISNFIL